MDDESVILAIFARVLGGRFIVDTAMSAREGLERIEHGAGYAIVISDYKMPGMDGVQFLARVREMSPDSVRVMLTGQGNLTAAAAAVNEGQIFRFFQKPIELDAIHRAMDDALAQHGLITAERVLLEQTLHGSVKALIDVLALVQPEAFGRANRIKALVSDIAIRLKIHDRWRLEIAALLSQLGSITLPSGTNAKLARGQPLSREEHAQLARAPAMAAELISEIPRLDEVRAILRDPVLLAGEPGHFAPARPAGSYCAANVLRAALDFDELESRGLAASTALDVLRGRERIYAPEVIAALADARGALAASTTMVREMRLSEVGIGMSFVTDVIAQNGVLLIARGQEVTPGLMERIRRHWRDVAGTTRVAMAVS